ncbi:efflux RND transporter periplasmic adaptor subunit [Shewanella maritima]|uniref:efflux RND transporter periplasmic adaptor subunit n=1 Tax=Shewanella maritima TaxID=2520507 RepID=UPI003735E2EE
MKKLFIFTVIVSVILLSVLVNRDLFAGRDNQNGQKPASRVVPVITSEVALHQASQELSLIGKLEADRAVYLSPQVSGLISEINLGVNNEVSQGSVVIQLDDAKAKAAVSEAKAYLVDEERKLNEYQALIVKNAITQTEIEAQKASVDMARARLASAQADLDYHGLTAPFSGTAGLVDFSVGKMVSQGSQLLALDDLSLMRLDLQVPEEYLSLIETDMQVSASSRAWPDKIFTGTILAIDSRVNPDTLHLRVRIVFDNQQQLLKPGMMMSATLAFAPISEPMIPVQAIEYSGTKRFVYLVDSTGHAKRTEVILGARIGDQVLISSGVDIGDQLVVQGLVNMRDGLALDIIPMDIQSPTSNNQASSKQANNNPAINTQASTAQESS